MTHARQFLRSNEEKIKSLEEHNAHLSSEVSSVTKYNIQLQAEFNILFQEHHALLEEFGLDKNGNPKAKPLLPPEKIAHIKAKYAGLRDQTTRIIKLDADLAAANEEIRLLKQKNVDAKVFTATPKSPRTTDLELALANVNKELRETKQKYEAEMASKPSAPTLAALTSENKNAKTTIAQLERNVKDLSHRLEVVTADMIRARETAESLTKKIETSSYELRHSRSSMEKRDMKIQELSNQLEAADADLRKQKGISERLANTVESLTFSLREAESNSESHLKRVDELTKLLADVTDAVMNDKYNSAAHFNKMVNEVMALEHTLAVAHAQIEQLKKAPVKAKNEKVPAEVARLNQIIQAESAEAMKLKTPKEKERIVDPVEVEVKPKNSKKSKKSSVRLYRPHLEFFSQPYGSADGLGIDTSATLERKYRFGATEPYDVFRSSDSTGAGSNPNKMDYPKKTI